MLLAFETSCDETSVAVVHGRQVLANVVSSQVRLHEEYGGVVPELAAREHLRNLVPVTLAALQQAGVTADQFVLMAALIESDSATQQELVRRTASDANTLRAMLLLLEKRGWICRGRHPKDRRARTVALTAEGRQAYDTAWKRSDPARAALSVALNPEETATLVCLLGRVAAIYREK